MITRYLVFQTREIDPPAFHITTIVDPEDSSAPPAGMTIPVYGNQLRRAAKHLCISLQILLIVSAAFNRLSFRNSLHWSLDCSEYTASKYKRDNWYPIRININLCSCSINKIADKIISINHHIKVLTLWSWSRCIYSHKN